MKTRLLWLPIFLISAIVFYACQKELNDQSSAEVPQGKQQVSLYLTDGPALFDSVLIDLQKVEVLVDTCKKSDNDDDDDDDHHGDHHGDDDRDNRHNDDTCKVWVDMQIAPGQYDLLSLRNGVDTLLANGNVPAGTVKKVKISLGTNNQLVKDSVRYPLRLFPGAGSTIIINFKHEDWDHYSDRRCRVWLDFDVARSIVVVRNNEFFLRPVVRPFVVARTGSVEGKVVPDSAFAVISVYNSSDTAYALPNYKGEFKIRGLKAGEYNMFINASNGFADSTITGLKIEAGKPKKLPTIVLHK
ncbi:MAG TPA: DUF4382 domain-containing protein [Phnomibacter sp.]|nr:DUF4382 domain-containing protein [Phnomibacter sp.]